MRNQILSLTAATYLLTACSGATTRVPAPPTAAKAVDAIADRYYAFALERQPTSAYFAGIETDRHDALFDNRPEAQIRAERVQDELYGALSAIDEAPLRGSSQWIAKALIETQLRNDIGLRVCRQELWNVSQMGGWHLGLGRVAALQPVATAAERAAALRRWSSLDAFIDQEMQNLRTGLAAGYSAPKVVVERVIGQVDGLLALAVDESPWYSPAARSGDAAFASEFERIIERQVNPALTRYRDFLRETYLPAARAELSVLTNPDGRSCYEASLRRYTTLTRSGRDVFELGQATVAANRAAVIERGREAYGLDEFEAILERAKNDPADGFTSKEELLEFSREMVRRAEAEMPRWVGRMPERRVIVVPFPEHEEGTGRSAHYRPGTETRPGEYRIPLYQPEAQSRGNAEAVAFHEAWPGHHLQVATAQSIEGLHPATRLIWFSGPGEGWARYSEALAEEMGLYQSTTGPILRRAWPARGMVVDPGIHLFGWTRQQAIDFMLISGRFPAERADDMVDRIAILPGQLTAYDSGGLEILALRRLAEQRLGARFDIREFHDRVLENGTIPLAHLRRHIEDWLDAETR